MTLGFDLFKTWVETKFAEEIQQFPALESFRISTSGHMKRLPNVDMELASLDSLTMANKKLVAVGFHKGTFWRRAHGHLWMFQEDGADHANGD